VFTEGHATLPPRGAALQSRGIALKINKLFRF
jgi:hypothetical protein